MSNIKEKILSSAFVNQGVIGKIKDYIYYHYISNKAEAHTDAYRKEILQDFWEVLNNYNWILASGSFLRFYRDGTMDGQDIDILINFDDFSSVKHELANRGYFMFGEFKDEFGKVTEYKLKYKNVDIDIIFVFKDEQGYYYTGSYIDPTNKKEVIREVKEGNRIVHGNGYCAYRKWLPDFESSEYEFKGMKFKGYHHPNEHLIAEYGNWHIYDPSFDFLSCPEQNIPKKYGKAHVIYYKEPRSEY